MSMAIKNTFKLVRVQAKQRKSILLFFAAFVAVSKLLSLIHLYANLNSLSLISDLNNDASLLSIVFIPILAISGINILTNTELKMYPGTVRTRYISRIITDHIFIVLFYLILLGINIVSEIGVVLIQLTGHSIGINLLFDVKYWLIGFAVYVSIGSLLYMLAIIIYTFATVLPNIVNIIIVLLTFLAARYEVFNVDILLYKITDFHLATNIGIGKLVLHAFIVWATLILIGFVTTFFIKTFKPEFSRVKCFALICMNIFIFIFLLSGYIFYDEDTTSELNYEGRAMFVDIPDGIDMHNYPEQCGSEVNNYYRTIFTMDYDHFKEGPTTETIDIPDKKVYVAFNSPKLIINNKNLSERLINNTEIDLANQCLVNAKNEGYYVVNNFLGNLYKYTKEYDSTYDYYTYDYDFGISAIIIYK